jgi:hypothetical protein
MSNGNGVGNVYYFNATPNGMTLLLNDHLLNASVAGVTKAGSYKPVGNSAPRNSADNSHNATFGTNNTLAVSFTAGDQTYTFKIDPNVVAVSNDVQLYIFFNQVVLVLPSGAGNDTQLVINGQPADKETSYLLARAREGGASEAPAPARS